MSTHSLNFQLGGVSIGSASPTFIIAEIAQSHDGSLNLAHAYIDAAADAGADAVKFQAHIASEESTLDEQFRVRFSSQDNTRFDYWKRMEFTFDQWDQLIKHAKSRDLVFYARLFQMQQSRCFQN